MMGKYRVVAREIRTNLEVDGEVKFLHEQGDIIELDDDDSRTQHYKDMRAIVPVRKKSSRAQQDEEPPSNPDPNASGTANNPAPSSPEE